MLDFVHPISPGRRRVALNGMGGQNETRRVAGERAISMIRLGDT
jgi:hypothetical protein